MKGDIYHLSTSTPHKAACGAMASAVRNGHALTGVASRITCPECRKHIRPEAMGQRWHDGKRRVEAAS